jgi:hypothetical protein
LSQIPLNKREDHSHSSLPGNGDSEAKFERCRRRLAKKSLIQDELARHRRWIDEQYNRYGREFGKQVEHIDAGGIAPRKEVLQGESDKKGRIRHQGRPQIRQCR